MIVKVQRSLETNELTGPQLLIYNRARDWMLQCPLTLEWNAWFGPTTSPHDNRFFARVTWLDRRRLPLFVRRVQEQGW